MSRRRVLAISQDLDQLRRIVANLERAGADVEAVRSPAAITGEIIPHRYVFFALGPGGHASLAEALPRMRDIAHVSVVMPDARLPDLTRTLADHRVNHVLVGDEVDRGVFVTAQKLLTGDIFGVEKYLPEGTQVRYARIQDEEGRARVVEEVLELAARSGVRGPVRTAVGAVCEELLMNALYGAPVGDDGVPLFAGLPPEDRALTSSPKPVSIRYAATEAEFALAVRDRFGRLAKRTILSHLESCLESKQRIDRSTYGAGLGLYRVASSAAGCVFNVAYDVATEVICTFDRGVRSPLRLIGVFVHPNGAENLIGRPGDGSDAGDAAARIE